jgi:hypothetical protein
MTVTSVASLAIEPPVLTVAINRKASTLPLLHRYGAFGVNILSSEQAGIAEQFTGKMGEWGRSASTEFRGRRAIWYTPANGIGRQMAAEQRDVLNGTWPAFKFTIVKLQNTLGDRKIGKMARHSRFLVEALKSACTEYLLRSSRDQPLPRRSAALRCRFQNPAFIHLIEPRR